MASAWTSASALAPLSAKPTSAGTLASAWASGPASTPASAGGATEVDGDGTSAGVTDRDAPQVELITLGRDGGVRDRQPLRPPEVETVHPNLTWAGDRIAVTWGERVSTPQVAQQHKLRWLSCP